MNIILDNTHTPLATLLVKEHARRNGIDVKMGSLRNSFRLLFFLMFSNLKITVAVNHCYRIKNIPVLIFCIIFRVEVLLAYEGLFFFRHRKLIKHYVRERYPNFVVALLNKIDLRCKLSAVLIPSFIEPIAHFGEIKSCEYISVDYGWGCFSLNHQKNKLIVKQKGFDHEAFLNGAVLDSQAKHYVALGREENAAEFIDFSSYNTIVGGYSSVLLHAKLLSPSSDVFYSEKYTELPPDWPLLIKLFRQAGLREFGERI